MLVPMIHPDKYFHKKENEVLTNLRNALDAAVTVLGPFQLTAMLNKEEQLLNHHLQQYYPLRLANGRIISVQANDTGAHRGRNDTQQVFTYVEVKDYDGAVRCLSAHELMRLINKNGGILDGHLPPLDFGRNPKRGAREHDEDIVDAEFRRMRKKQKHCLLYDKPLLQGTSCIWYLVESEYWVAESEYCVELMTIEHPTLGTAKYRIKKIAMENGMYIIQPLTSFSRVIQPLSAYYDKAYYSFFEKDRKCTQVKIDILPTGVVSVSIKPTVVLGGL